MISNEFIEQCDKILLINNITTKDDKTIREDSFINYNIDSI